MFEVPAGYILVTACSVTDDFGMNPFEAQLMCSDTSLSELFA